jgi:hypothetical protein
LVGRERAVLFDSEVASAGRGAQRDDVAAPAEDVELAEFLLLGRQFLSRPLLARQFLTRPLLARQFLTRQFLGRPLLGRPLLGRPLPARQFLSRRHTQRDAVHALRADDLTSH